MEDELGRRQRDERLDEPVVEPDVAPLAIDDRPRALECVERPLAEDLDPDLAQDPQRGQVDRLDLVGAQDLDRAERVDDRPPGEQGQPGRRPSTASAHPLRGHRRSLTAAR